MQHRSREGLKNDLDPGHLDDTALVKAAKSGNPRAFQHLVERHMREVYALAFRLVNHHADAEDISQDALVRVFRGLAGFREDASFRTWLYRIVINCFLNHRKAEQRRHDGAPGPDTPLPARRVPSPDEPLILDELKERLRREVASLPQRQRLAFVLHTYHGRKYDEIAAIMETSRENVKMNISLARKKLREMHRP
ncbi:MAG: RNA polymerase sigma factor [Planctomycetota bacterium]